MKGHVKNVQFRLINDNNELDLIELFRVIWNQKWVIVTILCFAIASGQLFIKRSTPVYEAKISISPPTLAEVEQFNLGRVIKKYTLLPPFNRQDVYNIFMENLGSASTMQDFLHDIKNSSPVASDVNKPVIPVVSLSDLSRNFLSKQFISVKYTDAGKATEWAKKYLDIANQNALRELTETIKTQNDILVNELQSRVKVAELALKNSTDASKSGLQTALHKEQLAKAINNNSEELNGDKKDIVELNHNLSQVVYESRIREMEENVELYKNLKIPNSASLYHLDGEITVPATRVSPHKGFILLLSIILGIILGISSAFFNVFIIKKNREIEDENRSMAQVSITKI